jgi:hypothetical protein
MCIANSSSALLKTTLSNHEKGSLDQHDSRFIQDKANLHGSAADGR